MEWDTKTGRTQGADGSPYIESRTPVRETYPGPSSIPSRAVKTGFLPVPFSLHPGCRLRSPPPLVFTVFLFFFPRSPRLALQTGATVLLLAAHYGRDQALKVLLELGADVETRDISGTTTVHATARHCHVSALRLLLKWGADPEAPALSGSSPMHVAAAFGNRTVVKVLLHAKCNVNALETATKRRPMHLAALAGAGSMVVFLATNGAWVAGADKFGWTPLHCAAFSGSLMAVKCLVARGAPVNAWFPAPVRTSARDSGDQPPPSRRF